METAFYVDDPDIYTVEEVAKGVHKQEAVMVKCRENQMARVVKRKMDEGVFYGQVVRVEYAPEWESVEETREKLGERARVVEEKRAQMEVRKKREAEEEKKRKEGVEEDVKYLVKRRDEEEEKKEKRY